MTVSSTGRAWRTLALLAALGLAIVVHDRLLGGFAPVFFGITPRPLVDGLPFEARAYVGFHGPRSSWVWGASRVSVDGRLLARVSDHEAREWWPSGTSLPVWWGSESALLAEPAALEPSSSVGSTSCRVDGIRVRTGLGLERTVPGFSIPIVPHPLPAGSNQAVALERAMTAVVAPREQAWSEWRKLDDPVQRQAILSEDSEALEWWDRATSISGATWGGGGLEAEWVRRSRRLIRLVAARSTVRAEAGDAADGIRFGLDALRIGVRRLDDLAEVAPESVRSIAWVVRPAMKQLGAAVGSGPLTEGERALITAHVVDAERAATRSWDPAAPGRFHEARLSRALVPIAELNPFAPTLDGAGRLFRWAMQRSDLEVGGRLRKSMVIDVAWVAAATRWEGLLAFSASSSCTDVAYDSYWSALELLLEARTIRCSISMQAYRARVGRWPSDAAELGAAVPGGLPIDPFGDGAPLRYRVLGDRAVLWSVGVGDDWEPTITPGQNEGLVRRFEPPS